MQNDDNMLGSADYLALEQALVGHTVDGRADIYSLGCVFSFLLTGHPPFRDGTLPQRLMAHQTQRPPSITDERPDAPADLIAICMKMMAKIPEDRYQSMDEVARALDRWLFDHRHFNVAEIGDVTVVRFCNPLMADDIDSEEFGRSLYSLVENDQRKKLVLNFSTVEFLNSGTLAKLITLDRKVKAQGGALKLSNIRPAIYEVFNITNLNRVLDIKEDEADALADF